MRLFLVFLVVFGSVANPLKLPDSLKAEKASKPVRGKADANPNITLTFTTWAAIYSEIKELQVFK